MNLAHKNLKLLFFLSFLLTAAFPVYSNLKLSFFAPVIVISFYQKSLPYSLWLSFICGLLFDVFNQPDLMGLQVLAFSMATIVLFNQKQNFFSDNITTLPLMTFFFSALSFGAESFLMYSINKGVNLSFKFIYTNLFLYPMIDAIYAFAFFIFPSLLFGKRRLRGSDYFTN